MSLFTEWNLLLLEEYFSLAKAGQDVWIPTTRDELDRIGVHMGGARGLIEAVKEGPSWLLSCDNIADKAKILVTQRKLFSKRPSGYRLPSEELAEYKNSNAPTYLPYVALWVLARSDDRGVGFYARVSELVNAPFPNNTRLQMEAVWKDLEFWSTVQENGKFGNFKLNVLGEHRYVGIPHSQALMKTSDIDGLSRLFGSSRLYPGQRLEKKQFEQLIEQGINSHFLSSGLRSAMGKDRYRKHLRQLITNYLEFWDGRVPKTIASNSLQPNEQQVHLRVLDNEVSIILRMKSDDDVDFWEIGWRVPAVVSGLAYALKESDGEETKAKLELAGTHICSVESVNQSSARQVIAQSATCGVEFVLSYEDSDGVRSERKFVLNKHKVRFFVWDEPDHSLRDSLIEREMPIRGPVYLLYSQKEYSNLELLLRNNAIQNKSVNIDGLPDDWALIYIDAIENLSPEERAEIADEEPSALTKARIRFVGGKPIIGAGSKKYAYYDLPIIELEAPIGTEISAQGLVFEELENVKDRAVYVRRFKLSIEVESRCVFKIEAKLEGDLLCTAGLQLLATGGIAAVQKKDFSIDNCGRTIRNTTGLCGASVGVEQSANHELVIDNFQIDENDQSDEKGIDIFKSIESNISFQFLDSIAIAFSGSMTYGVARNQIRRLANNMGIADIEPGLLIRNLRRCGYVEIETDVRGHMVRICSVPATIYSLPIKDSEHRQLYGICGSLRLQQWKELTDTTNCDLLVEITTLQKLPVVRLVPKTRSEINAFAKLFNFELVDLPVRNLVQWLGSVHSIRENLSWYPEQGLNPNYLERLNPSNASFKSAENILVDSCRKFELFRYEDPQIQGMRVYKLGKNLGDGILKYSFIQDSRWGVWMAMGAFSEWIKNEYGHDDACPWPIHYDFMLGSLWLPARMEPPFVIERALTLCAGCGPIVKLVTGESDGNSILLSDKGKGMIGKVSSVYGDMVNGKWLCYRWVPEAIASHVAGLLGGELKEIGCNTMSRKLEDKKCQLV